jgi:hypothetical protein
LAPALAFGAALAAGLEVFAAFVDETLVAADFVWPFEDFGADFEPASREAFFVAAGAFATSSSRRKAFPGITKTHVKSEKNPSDWVFSYYDTVSTEP